MWKPRYSELKAKAMEMKQAYESKVYNGGKTSIQAVKELSDEYEMPIKSIYRYLKSVETKYPKRKRGKNGRYI